MSPTSNHQHSATLVGGGCDKVGVKRTRHAVVFLFSRKDVRAGHDVVPVFVLGNVSSRSDHTLNRKNTTSEV